MMPVRNEGYNGEVIKYDYSPKFTAFEGESKRAKIAGQSSGMGVCLVCDAPCNGYHFSQPCCPACASFFRRSITLKKLYVCQSNQNCKVHFALRVICRGCRLEKCLYIGMDSKAVQPPRDNNFGRRKITANVKLIDNRRSSNYNNNLLDQNNRLQTIKHNGGYLESDNNTLMVPKPMIIFDHTYERCMGRCESTGSHHSSTDCSVNFSTIYSPSIKHEYIQSPITPLVEVNKQFRYITPSLLSHMMEVEKTTRERRRILFCNDDSIDDLFKHENDLLCFNEKEIKPMKFSKIRKDLRSMVLITYEWTRSRAYWPNLPTSDKITLLKRCVLYQTIIEPAFLTAKIGYPSKFIMANGMYVSMDKNSDAGWEDEPEISKAMKQNLYIDLMKRVIKDIVEPIRKMDLSVKEFVALKSIVCWKNGGVSEVTEETKKILNRDVEMMLKELHEYYLEQKFNEDIIAERMGNIILLLGSIFSLGLETIESHVKMSFFALWQFDSLVKKLFKET